MSARLKELLHMAQQERAQEAFYRVAGLRAFYICTLMCYGARTPV